jgi:hypothetical protein
MLNRQGVYVYNYIYLYMYTCFCTVTTSKYTYVYVYLNIRTWILDYLREGFPWPAQPFNLNIRKPVYLNIHSNIIYGWIWRFVLPPGPCGPPSTYLNVVTVYIHIYIYCIYIYNIYIWCYWVYGSDIRLQGVIPRTPGGVPTWPSNWGWSCALAVQAFIHHFFLRAEGGAE